MSSTTSISELTRDQQSLSLRCGKCAAKKICAEAQEGEVCWFEITDNTPDLKTAESILNALREKVKLDFVRYKRASRLQAAKGDADIDKHMTPLSNTITKDLQVLTDLSIRFGLIDEQQPLGPQSQPTQIQAENVNILQITQEELGQCQDLQEQLRELLQQKVLLSRS